MAIDKKKRPRAGFEGVGYPWAISLGIGGPHGGPGQPDGGSAPIAEDWNPDLYKHVTGDIEHDRDHALATAKALGDHYAMHHPDLVKRHGNAIQFFTKNAKYTNKYLAQKKEAYQSGEHHIPVQTEEKMAHDVSSAIHSAKPYDKPISVYSGMHSSVPPHVIHQHGGIFHFPRFLSTTTNPEMALRFASKNKSNERHVVKFDVPAGYKHGAFIAPGSEYKDENEYLIDRDRMIHISHKISSKTNKEGVTTHLWQGHLLHPDEAANHAAKHPFAQAEYDSFRKATSKSLFESLLMEFAKRDVPNSEDSLGKARYTMPQVHKEELLKDIGKDGFTRESVDTSSLTPTQKHFNWDKVDGIASSGKPIPEIIVSRDGYVIDGHHRWLGAHNRDGKINIVRVRQNADDLLKFLKDKPYVITKKLNEAKFEVSVISEIFPDYRHV